MLIKKFLKQSHSLKYVADYVKNYELVPIIFPSDETSYVFFVCTLVQF